MSERDSERRVVVTGIGVVSPIGIGIAQFWNRLNSGKSGIDSVHLLPAGSVPNHIAGEVRDFVEKKYVKQKKSIKVMCREIQLGVASASLALESAGLADEKGEMKPGVIDPEQLGVDFGANLMLSPPSDLGDACFACVDETTQKFDYQRWGNEGLGKMAPLWLLKYLPNMPACHIGISADARGPNNSITLDEASGNLVIGEALRVIARGSAKIMITGSTGTRLHAVKTIHAAMWDELAMQEKSPVDACRPFDKKRSGQVVGEGACTVILEEEEHARGRQATVWGRILGAGSACVLDKSNKADIRRALILAMKAALNDAKVPVEEVGHINAHGAGTLGGDAEEAAAIYEVFGSYASKVPVTALKSYMGNSGSGCGVLELAGSLAGLRHGVIPPTLNYSQPDDKCPLNVVAGKPLATKNPLLLKLSYTRQGQASVVVASGMPE